MAANVARAVTLSARQIDVFNIAEFKARKEQRNKNQTFSAEQIAKFWDEKVSKANGGEQLQKNDQ